MVQHSTYTLIGIIALMLALPQLSEAIYSLSLPDMAKDLGVLAAHTEYTLTIYLLGFACGVLNWGTFSDHYGRRKGIIIGLAIYTLSSFACWFAKDITIFYILRFIQAFGASAGVVVGQALARDIVSSTDRGRIYSTIGMILAFAPAIGPLIGAFIVQAFHWTAIFPFLGFIGILIIGIVMLLLPRTQNNQQNKFSLAVYKDCAMAMASNKRTWGLALFISFINGIIFSYFAESPFYFIELLGLSKTTFGSMAVYICIPIFCGGLVSKNLNKRKVSQDTIIWYGTLLIFYTGIVFFTLTKLNIISTTAPILSAILTVILMSLVVLGNSMIAPNCFSQALEPFGKFSGTAASIFGFTYYIFISLLTGLTGWLHDGTLHTLPLCIVLSGGGMVLSHIIFIRGIKLID